MDDLLLRGEGGSRVSGRHVAHGGLLEPVALPPSKYGLAVSTGPFQRLQSVSS